MDALAPECFDLRLLFWRCNFFADQQRMTEHIPSLFEPMHRVAFGLDEGAANGRQLLRQLSHRLMNPGLAVGAHAFEPPRGALIQAFVVDING